MHVDQEPPGPSSGRLAWVRVGVRVGLRVSVRGEVEGWGVGECECEGARLLDARPERVANCYARYSVWASLIQIVCDLAQHRGSIAMVGIIESVTGVPVTRWHVSQVP